MMKNYINNKNQVFGFELDGSQDHLITTDMVAISDEDLVILRAPTAEQVAEQSYSTWKASRQLAVDSIEVTYDLIIYQGDEVSQGRMSRSIAALPDDVMTVQWIAKDNSAQLLNKVQLKAILLDAGTKQSAIWNEGRP